MNIHDRKPKERLEWIVLFSDSKFAEFLLLFITITMALSMWAYPHSLFETTGNLVLTRWATGPVAVWTIFWSAIHLHGLLKFHDGFRKIAAMFNTINHQFIFLLSILTGLRYDSAMHFILAGGFALVYLRLSKEEG